MIQHIDFENSPRKYYIKLFKNLEDSMFCVNVKVDVTRLYKLKKQHKFNSMFLWCICKASKKVPEFKYEYNRTNFLYSEDLAIRFLVKNKVGQLNICDILYNENFEIFEANYNNLVNKIFNDCKNHIENEVLKIKTSYTKIDNLIAVAPGKRNTFEPTLLWGNYYNVGLKKYLNIAFHFSHLQFNGEEINIFMSELQKTIKSMLK